MDHSNLEMEIRRHRYKSTKIVGHSYVEKKKNRSQLFGA